VRERLARPRVYTPANTERFERAVAWEATAALRTARLEPFAGFVRLRVWAFFALSLDGDRPAHEPDADNVLKVVGDALNKVAYRDDRDVADAIAHKRFTVGEPFVRVRVTPLAFDLLEVARGR
jgi:Holliday junction resolvase RusA-like endonuclease